MTPEQRREYERLYRERNKERIAERKRASYQRNRAKVSDYNRRYYQENRPQVLARTRAYREGNLDTLREKGRTRYRQNRDKVLEERREYYQQNSGKIGERGRIYRNQNRARIRARELRDRHGIAPEEWASLWQAQDGQCYLCGEDLGPSGKVHVDHDHSCCPDNQSCAICRRGLAHDLCNVAIGFARDDPAKLRRMADALEAAQRAVEQRKAAAYVQLDLLEGA